jgi:ParB family chromosome partitioning protein
MNKEQPKRLGRGLAALLGDVAAPTLAHMPGVQTVRVDMMGPSPFQPRKEMDPAALQELADSIRKQGILQPLLVRPIGGVDGAYHIIAGERRWRAAQMAQLHEVPVLVRAFSDAEAMAAGLVENLQREDLNPVEEALGFQRLLQEFGMTQERLAEAIGKPRTHVAHMLRILKLPEAVVEMVKDGALSVGHARALTQHADPTNAAKIIVEKQLSVRETEMLVEDSNKPGGGKKAMLKKPVALPDPETVSLQESLSERLGLKVKVSYNGKGGAVVLNYKTLDQLDSILTLLNG